MMPQVDIEFKERRKKIQLQNNFGHEIYIQNQTQPFAFDNHF